VLASVLGEPQRRELLERAVLPDRFQLAVAAAEIEREPRAVALYLPALDLVAADWPDAPEPFAELVRLQLQAVDRLLASSAARAATTVVVLDPGRRGGGEGRVLLGWGRCGSELRPRIEPEQVASALLRVLGLPQSRELPEPPGFCTWPEPPAVVPTYGERSSEPPEGESSGAYLENLRSLGYL